MEYIIKPPEGCLAKDIKQEVTVTNSTMKIVLTYPNGFSVTTVIKGDVQNITTSGELIDLGNGVYQIPK